jgi:hypothetical protein
MIIAFTVSNRPEYLRQTLESWSAVRGIGDCHLVFSCEPGCAEAVRICESVTFAPRTVLRNHDRGGVLGNPWRALSYSFGSHHAFGRYLIDLGFVVLAEEDLVVSPDVVEYFSWSQRYAPDRNVLGVTTYQHDERPGGLPGVGPADWSRDNSWHFWVWGTWRDRWESLIRDYWDFTYRENGGGPGQRGWDWALRNNLVIGKGMKMIAPSMARSQHIGKFGGAHCQPQDFERLLSPSFAGLDVPPQEYREVNGHPLHAATTG